MLCGTPFWKSATSCSTAYPLWTSTGAKQVPEGKKSVTLRLTIGSAEKTLTSQEIEACAASAVKRLAKHVGAELRGK